MGRWSVVGGLVGRWVSGRWSVGRWSVGKWSVYLIKPVNFKTQMTLRHLLLMPMDKILDCKDHQIYSKML